MINAANVFGEQFKTQTGEKADYEDSYWIRWTTIGQKVFGTFEGTFQIEDDWGNPVTCYKFRGGEGCQSEVSKLGVIDLTGKLYVIRGKKFIDMQMEGVVPGQVIGAEYEKDVPTQNPSPAKSIVLHKPTADGTPNGTPLMDPNFDLNSLAAEMNGRVVSQPVTQPQQATGTAPHPATGVAQQAPAPQAAPQANAVSADPLATIKQLALTKLPIATEENWQAQVMESTGLYLGEQNYQAITEKLQAMN